MYEPVPTYKSIYVLVLKCRNNLYSLLFISTCLWIGNLHTTYKPPHWYVRILLKEATCTCAHQITHLMYLNILNRILAINVIVILKKTNPNNFYFEFEYVSSSLFRNIRLNGNKGAWWSCLFLEYIDFLF